MSGNRRGIRHARTGCWQCKQRRRKCTEEKPRCLSCQKRNSQCHYGQKITWADDATDVYDVDDLVWTLLPKQPATWTRARETEQPDTNAEAVSAHGLVHFINLQTDDMTAILSSEGGRPATNPRQAAGEVPFSLSRSPSASRLMLGESHSHTSLQLLDYYTNNWCPRKVLVDGPGNGYRNLVLPVLPSSSGLKHAILALAAFDYPHEGMFRSVALHHKSLALQHLRRNIDALVSPGAAAVPANYDSHNLREAVLTTLIMCISDITTGSTKEWVTHLHGASALFRLLGRQRAILDDGLMAFCRQYFIIRDVFSRTAHDDASAQSNGSSVDQVSALWESLLGHESSAQLDEISIYVGCSERLVAIISAITTLARQKREYRQRHSKASREAHLIERELIGEQDFLARATLLQSQLDSLHEKPCDSAEAPVSSGYAHHQEKTRVHTECDRVLLYSLLFKSAARLYLRHAGFDIPIAHACIQQELLPELLALLARVEVREREVYPMWPLFIASCMAVSEAHRRLVLDQFKRLREVWTLGNIGVTESSVQWVWKYHDISPRGQQVAGLAVNGTNMYSGVDWDKPLKRLGWRISLT